MRPPLLSSAPWMHRRASTLCWALLQHHKRRLPAQPGHGECRWLLEVLAAITLGHQHDSPHAVQQGALVGPACLGAPHAVQQGVLVGPACRGTPQCCTTGSPMLYSRESWWALLAQARPNAVQQGAPCCTAESPGVPCLPRHAPMRGINTSMTWRSGDSLRAQCSAEPRTQSVT
jgi:hypothetical protein